MINLPLLNRILKKQAQFISGLYQFLSVLRIVFISSLQHKCSKWPTLDELGMQVEGVPLIPAIAKSVMKRLPSKLDSLVVPLLSSPGKSSSHLDTLSAVLNLL